MNTSFVHTPPGGLSPYPRFAVARGRPARPGSVGRPVGRSGKRYPKHALFIPRGAPFFHGCARATQNKNQQPGGTVQAEERRALNATTTNDVKSTWLWIFISRRAYMTMKKWRATGHEKRNVSVTVFRPADRPSDRPRPSRATPRTSPNRGYGKIPP